MFLSLVIGMFGWLPFPLRCLVAAVFVVFSIFVVFALVRMIFTLMEFIVNMLGGIFGKVVSLFM